MFCYEIGSVISELRTRSGMTQEELAENICAPATISKIERSLQMPSKRTMDELMDRLGIAGSSFFTGIMSTEELISAVSWEKLLFTAKKNRRREQL